MGRLSLDEIQRLLTEVAEDMGHKIESAAADSVTTGLSNFVSPY